MTYSPPLVPQTPQHKRHGVRNGCLLSFAIAAAAAVVIGVVAAALRGGGSTAGHPAATSTTTAAPVTAAPPVTDPNGKYHGRSEEHTSELQSRPYLLCRLLLVT